MLDAPVALAGVVKRYGARPALDGFDLRVAQGEVFGFLGPNGAGKTTAIRIALGLLRPDAGSVRVLGRDPWIDGVAERARIGYLPSGPRFYDRMRGVDLLDHLAALGGGRIPGRGRALDLLELSRADLARPIREYSRGMRQKLGIVQAVQHEPELLVLDEPTEGLDPHRAGGVLRARARAPGGRRDRALLVPRAERGRGALRASRHDPRRPDDHGAHPLRDAGLTTQDRPYRVRATPPRPRTSSSRARCASSSTAHASACPTRVIPSTLVRALAAERIVDLEIEKASLEGIFLSLYRADEPGAPVWPHAPSARTGG